MRVFGCIAHAKKLSPHPPKLADRSVKTILLGYEEESKVYRLLNPLENKIIVSRDVVFEEDKSWSWTEKLQNVDTGNIFTVHQSNTWNNVFSTNENQGNTGQNSPSTPSTPATTSSSDSSTPKKYRSLQEIYDETREEVGLCFLSIEEPVSYEDAARNVNWRFAME